MFHHEVCRVWGTYFKSGGGGDNIVEQGLTTDHLFNVVWSIPRVDKEKVLSLNSQGMSRNAIAKEFGCARATITRVLKSVET